ncbi:Transmembrane protein [Planoprotostelium fungivorum]|uniref:ER membrane protein complex subunit 3 n=1 Tax=Planoprotostelium fungivorum TaxID=1890364 RepID=A0A2P6N651_9EUKA|nr:Transmembrane protein [Planoprotostelium fungivorum]
MTRPNTDIELDSAIRNWVLIPIIVVMFLIAILRHHIMKLMRDDKKPDLKSIREMNILLRARRLRASANKLSYSAFVSKKTFFNNKEVGLFRERPDIVAASNPMQAANPLANPAMNPINMVDMMKKNMVMYVPQMFLMTWVSYFFSGFVCAKLPFPLTQTFRTMLQRGVELNTLDVSYVSSLSWYFLTLFGLGGVNSIVLGEQSLGDDTSLMRDQMMMGMGGGGGMPGAGPSVSDLLKIYQSERENLELINHEWELQEVEYRIMKKAVPKKEIGLKKNE